MKCTSIEDKRFTDWRLILGKTLDEKASAADAVPEIVAGYEAGKRKSPEMPVNLQE